MTIAVQAVDGRIAVLVTGESLRLLGEYLARSQAVGLRNGGLPTPRISEAVALLRHAAVIDELRPNVPQAVQNLDTDGGPAAVSLSTGDAARLLGVTPRAIRQRISRGRLPAQRRGRDYLIDSEDLRGTA